MHNFYLLYIITNKRIEIKYKLRSIHSSKCVEFSSNLVWPIWAMRCSVYSHRPSYEYIQVLVWYTPLPKRTTPSARDCCYISLPSTTCPFKRFIDSFFPPPTRPPNPSSTPPPPFPKYQSPSPHKRSLPPNPPIRPHPRPSQ